VNKAELIAKIAKDTGSSKANAATAVDSLIEGITKELKQGREIHFVGFGTFKTSARKARAARNPQTGAAIKIPTRRVIRFSAGAALKEAVGAGKPAKETTEPDPAMEVIADLFSKL